MCFSLFVLQSSQFNNTNRNSITNADCWNEVWVFLKGVKWLKLEEAQLWSCSRRRVNVSHVGASTWDRSRPPSKEYVLYNIATSTICNATHTIQHIRTIILACTIYYMLYYIHKLFYILYTVYYIIYAILNTTHNIQYATHYILDYALHAI